MSVNKITFNLLKFSKKNLFNMNSVEYQFKIGGYVKKSEISTNVIVISLYLRIFKDLFL